MAPHTKMQNIEVENGVDSAAVSASGSKLSKVFSIRIPNEQAAKVENLSIARGVSPSKLLALMLDDYMNNEARIRFAEGLLKFEGQAVRRDAGIEKVLVSLDSRLEKFERVFREALEPSPKLR